MILSVTKIGHAGRTAGRRRNHNEFSLDMGSFGHLWATESEDA